LDLATDEQLKEWLGKPHFKRRVTYTYSPQMNAFTFFTPGRGRGMEPIGVFTPLHKHGITYDVEGVVEEIAEHMSLFDNHEYFDIESQDED
jgi:hypothetical protein